MVYSIVQLNEMTQAGFTEVLSKIFEDSPWVAQESWTKRPFEDVNALHQVMVEMVNNSSLQKQLDLICAHPDLATKAKMAEASVKEQAGVGLDRLSAEEYERFQHLNQAYKDKFGFPFIIAVKNHTKESILEAFEKRLNNSQEAEKDQALTEIGTIAKFRLLDLIV
ncbi:MAG: 2-oxo-4-hydroxy-4-carboxy-5-ureidoimidazoline decarboxylase [Snowella sp.]|nr:2-oxo-4-hydroxy-4-carboxy-5-ureidoimidazoline decarboxylase [Snowella sp.]